MKALLLVLLLSPFVSAPLIFALGRRLGPKTGWPALIAPLFSFLTCVALYLQPAEARVAIDWAWVPALGVQLSFTPDGLSLFFGLVVTAIGILVTLYSTTYLDARYENHGQFYCFLQLFMGSMLATVFSSNLLVLFTAWELTGIASFFLIGFLYDEANSRRGARMALLTTSLTGLALLVGVVLLQQIFGTYELGAILQTPLPPGKEALASAAFVFCFVGIAGKSALFPFQYWLPNAMAAPTPVSAYLHSATMVKLGVFLTARLAPVFAGLELWTPLLVGIGFLTFLFGAILAWFSYDLKSVLAYTTIAQLGALVGQLGWASQQGAVFSDFVHILNHSMYKACLFMVVGIIDHSAGTRDLRQLGGMLKKMPLVGTAALVALAAMAGLPITSGFLSKELMIEGALAFRSGDASLLGSWPLLTSLAASTLHVMVALRIAKHVFFGEVPAQVEASFHPPTLAVQLSPMVLGAAILYFGLQPLALGTFTASFGPPALPPPVLSLWHGWTPTLWLSLGIFAAGGLVFWVSERRSWPLHPIPRPLRFDLGAEGVIEGIPVAGGKLDRALGFQRSSLYLPIIAAIFVGALVVYAIAAAPYLVDTLKGFEFAPQSIESGARWLLVLVISTAALCAAAWKRPVPQLFAVSVVGLGIALYYILYRAPDLALTQFLVETATLFLLLLVLFRLKRDHADREHLPARTAMSRLSRLVISAGTGLILGLGILLFQNEGVERAGEFYVQNTVPLAKGANAVNTVVVDFRGFDTMLEITVLVIAALGCLGLLFRPSTKPRPAPPLHLQNLFPAPWDFILRSISLGAFIPLNLLSLYIFLRGHDAAGGGFVAGLITALSMLLLVFGVGIEAVRQRLPADPMRIAAAGVLLAVATAIAPSFFGYSLLHHFNTALGPLTVGTPMILDVGVFLAVVGATLKLILPLMRSVSGLPIFDRRGEARFTGSTYQPIDLDQRVGAAMNANASATSKMSFENERGGAA